MKTLARRITLAAVVCCFLCARAGAKVTMRSQAIRVVIDGRVATTTIEQVYANDAKENREVTFAFRPDDGAVVHDLAMWLNGVRCPAVVSLRARAREIYREIVGDDRDPAILEYVGRGAYRLRVFPVPPGGTQKIQIVLSHVLPIKTGRIVYRTPQVLRCMGDFESISNAGDLEFSAVIRCRDGVKDFRADTHAMDVSTHGDGRVSVALGAKGVNVWHCMGLSFAPGKPPGDVVTWRDGPRRTGFWAATPSLDALIAAAGKRRRNFVLVLDASASMLPEKLALLKKAADEVLTGLDDTDRFALVTVRGDATLWAPQLAAATKDRIAAARKYVAALTAGGGTDLAAGFRAAGALNADKTDPCYVVVLSDGDDMVGARGVALEAALAAKAQPGTAPPENMRLCWFRIGENWREPDVALPRRWGMMLGDYNDFRKGTNEAFWTYVGTPMIADARAVARGPRGMNLGVVRIAPPRRGAKLTVAGVCDKPGTVEVEVSAKIDGRRVSARHKLAVPASGEAPGAGRTAQAMRKLGARLLCEQLWARLQGDKTSPAELERLVTVSRREGVVTSATALLILEAEGEYIARGLRPPSRRVKIGQRIADASTPADRAPVSAELSAKIADMKKRARRHRAAGQHVAAARVLRMVSRRAPTEFDAALEASILETYAGVRKLVAMGRRPNGPPGNWQEMLQPVDVVSLIPVGDGPVWRPKPAAMPSLPHDPAAWAKLRRKVPKVDFTNVQLRDALDVLGKTSGVDMRVDWDTLLAEGVDKSTPVTVHLRDVTLAEAIRQTLASVPTGVSPLGCQLRKDVLAVSTARRLGLHTVTLAYDVSDLSVDRRLERGLLPSHVSEPVSTQDSGGFYDDEGGGGDPRRRARRAGSIPRALRDEDSDVDLRGLFRSEGFDVRDILAPVPNFRGPRVELSHTSAADRDEGPAEQPSSAPLAPGVGDLASLLRQTVAPESWAQAGGRLGSIRPFRGLMVVRQTPANHREIQAVLTRLRRQARLARRDRIGHAKPPLPPESLFTRQARLTPWVLQLLRRAKAGQLSKFSSVVVRKVAGRTFARIGGIWFDLALTAKSQVYLVVRGSAAAAALLAAGPDVKTAFALGRSVVLAVAPDTGVSVDQLGIVDAKNETLRKVIGAIKRK